MHIDLYFYWESYTEMHIDLYFYWEKYTEMHMTCFGFLQNSIWLPMNTPGQIYRKWDKEMLYQFILVDFKYSIFWIVLFNSITE